MNYRESCGDNMPNDRFGFIRLLKKGLHFGKMIIAYPPYDVLFQCLLPAFIAPAIASARQLFQPGLHLCFGLFGNLTHSQMPCMKFLFVRPDVCRRLPSDFTSR